MTGSTEQTRLGAERMAEVLKAMADDTRLRMLLALASEPEVCGCEFETGLGITQSKASRHLRYMRSAGLVKDRRQGVWVYYRLSEDMPRQVRRAIAAVLETLSPQERVDLDSRHAAGCCPQGDDGCRPPNATTNDHPPSCKETSHDQS